MKTKHNFSLNIILFTLALAINIFWLYTARWSHNPKGTNFYISGVELQKDLKAAEFFLENGTHYFGTNIWNEPDYTYRLPGFLFLYVPLRLVFDIHGALTAIVFLHVLLGAFASVLLAFVLRHLTASRLWSLVGWLLFMVGGYVQHYNFGLNREALTAYVLIAGCYLFYKWLSERRLLWLLLLAPLLTWAFLYRAFLVVPVFLIFAYLTLEAWHHYRRFPVKVMGILAMLPLLFFSYWIPRNYILTGNFIPLETSYMESKTRKVTIKLIHTWGGEVLQWYKGSEASWFNKPEWMGGREVPDSVLPDFIFNETLTIDTLRYARACYWDAIDKNLPLELRRDRDMEGARVMSLFLSFQKKTYPFRTYIGSKINYLITYLTQPKGMPVKSLAYPINVSLSFVTAFINLLIIWGGFVASIFLLLLRFKHKYLYYSQIVIFFIVVFFVLFYDIELRRIAYAYPFLLANLCYSGHIILKNSKPFALVIGVIAILVLTYTSYMHTIQTFLW